ncbi:MAG: hypothetical protein ACSHX5_04800 [Phycisphaerales bacterium]
MNKIATIAGLAVAATAMTASAEDLLIIDLSVSNQITMTATNGLASASATGGSFTGVLMADFYSGAGGNGHLYSGGTGDLVAAGDVSDGSPAIFNSAGNFGLNFWSWTASASSSFTAGELAFTGSATVSGLDAADYADMLAGNASGNIIAFADTDDDVGVVIGQWTTIPAPSSAAILGLGGIVAGRRRR